MLTAEQRHCIRLTSATRRPATSYYLDMAGNLRPASKLTMNLQGYFFCVADAMKGLQACRVDGRINPSRLQGNQPLHHTEIPGSSGVEQ